MIVVNIFGADVTVCAECANFIIDELGAHSIEAELFFCEAHEEQPQQIPDVLIIINQLSYHQIYDANLFVCNVRAIKEDQFNAFIHPSNQIVSTENELSATWLYNLSDDIQYFLCEHRIAYNEYTGNLDGYKALVEDLLEFLPPW